MRRSIHGLVAAAILVLPGVPLAAQDQTLADIRQQLTILYVEVQRLKRELSTTGPVSGTVGGATVLDRVNLMEGELERLTALSERLQNRINEIVADGTRRIGDLEFRLVELEGGDVSQLGETTTLGGGAQGQAALTLAPQTADPMAPEMAISEQQDFDIALTALNDGNYQDAAVKFTLFAETYPVGPLTGEAHFMRGQALSALGDTANAARAYLESFSGAPQNPRAADALFNLGLALGDLGQLNEACIALQQVPVRYPLSDVAASAGQAAADLGCL